jgi:transcription initiation factor TFIIB
MCPICKRNDKIITDTGCGEVICSNCGTVVSDRGQGITSPERLAFNSQEKNIRSRTGIPLSLTFAESVLDVSCLKTGEDKTQTQIAKASGVTDVTIRTRYKEIKNKLLNQTVVR